jgi:hypothetical protein
MTVFKIRRKSDGLYSEAGPGGPWVGFSEIGKTWNHRRHVVTHMNCVDNLSSWHSEPNPYKGLVEIVEFELVEKL